MKIGNPLAAWNALLILSILVLLAAFTMHFLLPEPKQKLGMKQRVSKEGQLRDDADALREKMRTDEQTVRTFVWPGDAKRAESEAMALVTGMAKKHEVSLGAFRPQKAIEDQGMRRLPFSLSLEGSFPDILRFLSELETPSNRLAVQMLQMSSSDSSSDQVSATMTVVAFQELVAPKRAGESASLATKTEAPAKETDHLTVGESVRSNGERARETPVQSQNGSKGPETNQNRLNNRALKASQPN